MVNKTTVISALLLSCACLCAQVNTVTYRNTNTGRVLSEIAKFETSSGTTYNFDTEWIKNVNNAVEDMFHLGKQYYDEGDLKEAKKYLVDYVDADIKGVNMEWLGYPYNMYRVYKYEACEMLRNIYYFEKNYKRSFYYFKEKRNYIYAAGCSVIDKNITVDDIYFYICYNAMGDENKALQTIIGKIIESTPVDTILVKEIVNKVKQINDNQFLKDDLNANIEMIQENQFSIVFAGYKIYIYNIAAEDKRSYKYNIEKAQKNIRNHLFYKLIMQD